MMLQNPISDGNPVTGRDSVHKKSQPRKSGTLGLFLTDNPVAADLTTAYARFRVCRGFIDDLNSILPIRLRIRLESELLKGGMRGQVDGPVHKFRWEFMEHFK